MGLPIYATSASFLGLACLLFLIALIIAHIAFAIGVYRAAAHLKWCGEQVWFGGPWLWMFAALATGIFGVIGYWLIHHSSIRAPRRNEYTEVSE